MNTGFITENKNPDKYARIIKMNFRDMTDGNVSEREAVDFISAILPAAKPCQHNSDLWFWMFEEPSNMPSDCRVEYVYETTYRLAGIIIYALTKYESVKNIPGIMDTLHKTLAGCMGRNFMGHGFERLYSFLTAMKVFARSNVNRFFEEYEYDFAEFAEFYKAQMPLLENIAADRVRGDWGESLSDKGKAILDMLSSEKCPIRLFVYGTLMKGQGAHHYLENAEYLGEYVLDRYAMYDLGSFPGIVPSGDGYEVIGEVYEISSDMLPFMDRYEGEGSLYIRREECVTKGEESLYAYVYVYNSDPDGKRVEGKWGT